MTIRNLDRLLEPASIAVIGASDRPASVGATVWRNLRAGKFSGPIYPVNPKHATLDGQPVFARPADLPQAPDLAVLCTPADSVAALTAQLGRLGTRAAIVMTAGLQAWGGMPTIAFAMNSMPRLNGHIAATRLRNVNELAAHPSLVDAAQVEPCIAD